MNKVNLWAILALLVASCSKAPKLEPMEESHEGKTLLSFSIDGFAQENHPFPKSPRLQSSIKPLRADGGEGEVFNLRDHVNVVEYKIFKQTQLIDSVRQYASDPDFGTYKKYVPASRDSTSAQQFNIYVAAAMLEDGQSMRIAGKPVEVALNFPSTVPDAFHYYTGIPIFEESPHSLFKLRRLVGKVEVIPTDTVPENAGRVEIEVHDVAKWFEISRGLGYFNTRIVNQDGTGNELKSISIRPEDVGSENITFSNYFMLKDRIGTTAAPRTVTITTYDKDNKVLVKRVVPNVNLQINQITRLRGPIFSKRPNADFAIELDTEWSPEIPEVDF